MLSDKVQGLIQSKDVTAALKITSTGRSPIDVRPVTLQAAVNDIKAAFQYVVTKYGLPHLSTPRPAPLLNDFVMRALVMLRCIYKYEVLTGIDNAFTIKGGLYDGLSVRAPGREDLCGKNGGLIVEAYKALGLEALGYEASCGGTVGVMQAAHLLAEAGLILERSETQIAGMDPEKDADKIAAYKKAKTPYGLTPVGRLFCFWLYGDRAAVSKDSGVNFNGYSGIKSNVQIQGISKSGWLNFLELDFPTSGNGDNISSTHDDSKNKTNVDVISIEESRVEDSDTVASKKKDLIVDDIGDTLKKLASTYIVEVEVESDEEEQE